MKEVKKYLSETGVLSLNSKGGHSSDEWLADLFSYSSFFGIPTPVKGSKLDTQDLAVLDMILPTGSLQCRWEISGYNHRPL
jgi:hypothetical protein